MLTRSRYLTPSNSHHRKLEIYISCFSSCPFVTFVPYTFTFSAKAGNNPGAPGGEAANWYVPKSFRVCHEDQAASLFLFRHKSDGIGSGILKDAQLVCVRLVGQLPEPAGVVISFF